MCIHTHTCLSVTHTCICLSVSLSLQIIALYRSFLQYKPPRVTHICELSSCINLINNYKLILYQPSVFTFRMTSGLKSLSIPGDLISTHFPALTISSRCHSFYQGSPGIYELLPPFHGIAVNGGEAKFFQRKKVGLKINK